MTIYTIKLFGRASIHREETAVNNLPAKAQELLFFLIIHGNRVHTRERLAGQLWGDASDTQAKKYMRQTLWHLQASLDQDAATAQPLLLLDNQWLQFNRAASAIVDIDKFERIFEAVRMLPDDGISADQAVLMLGAIRLYEAELLQGWYLDWCLLARDRFHAMYLLMVDKLMHHCLYCGDFDTGVALGLSALQFDGARERTHRRLMRLFHAGGDRTSALRQFEICASALAREFNLPPSERTVRLYEEVRHGEGMPAKPILPSPAPSAGGSELGVVLGEVERLHTSLAALRAEVCRLADKVGQGAQYTAVAQAGERPLLEGDIGSSCAVVRGERFARRTSSRNAHRAGDQRA
jgi:DNA-binding SARP family transcriptional activator